MYIISCFNYFVYLLVTFHTFQNQAFFNISMPNSAEKWVDMQKSN